MFQVENLMREARGDRPGGRVGIGALYRHFPTREALVEAGYRNELTRVCDRAHELLAGLRDHPT